MNIDDLMEKMDEAISLARGLHAKSDLLQSEVESLRAEVADLRERLTYRERVLVGWREIAKYMGYLDPASARDRAREPIDPLPVWRENGRTVCAFATALDAYKARHRELRLVAKFDIDERKDNLS